MKRKLRTALSFSLSDWTLFFQAWVLLLGVDLALRLLPFPRVRDAAAGALRTNETGKEIDARRIQRMVHTAAWNHLYPMRCLRKALVLQWLLGRRGVETHLRFGVNRDEGDLNAHAWLERDGQPVGERWEIVEHFAPLVSRF